MKLGGNPRLQSPAGRPREPSSLAARLAVERGVMSNPSPDGLDELGREDELKLLGFLATLAGLLGVVVAVSQFQVGPASSSTVRAYFAVSLVIFMFLSALAYLGSLQGKDMRQWNLAVLGYFAALLGLVVGLAAATLFPIDYHSSDSGRPRSWRRGSSIGLCTGGIGVFGGLPDRNSGSLPGVRDDGPGFVMGPMGAPRQGRERSWRRWARRTPWLDPIQRSWTSPRRPTRIPRRCSGSSRPLPCRTSVARCP